jgi:hypothetical protein
VRVLLHRGVIGFASRNRNHEVDRSPHVRGRRAIAGQASAPIYDQPLSVLISQFDGTIGWLVAGCAIVCTHLGHGRNACSFCSSARGAPVAAVQHALLTSWRRIDPMLDQQIRVIT